MRRRIHSSSAELERPISSSELNDFSWISFLFFLGKDLAVDSSLLDKESYICMQTPQARLYFPSKNYRYQLLAFGKEVMSVWCGRLYGSRYRGACSRRHTQAPRTSSCSLFRSVINSRLGQAKDEPHA
jgi:hypothetical protein